MGGAGHMLHAIKTLKANRNLLKKRSLRKKGDYKRIIDEDTPVFKKATKEQMKAIKSKIKGYKKTEIIINIISLILTLTLLAFVTWLIIK